MEDRSRILTQGLIYSVTTTGSSWYFFTEMPVCWNSGQCSQCLIAVILFCISTALLISLVYFAVWLPMHSDREKGKDNGKCQELEM